MNVKYFDLINKKVFISGGADGIGSSIVENFCEQGAEVIFVDINMVENGTNSKLGKLTKK